MIRRSIAVLVALLAGASGTILVPAHASPVAGPATRTSTSSGERATPRTKVITGPLARAAAAGVDDQVRGRTTSRSIPTPPRRLHALVVPLFSGSTPPQSATSLAAAIKGTAAWFAQVSRGKQHLRAKILPWQRITRVTRYCYGTDGTKPALAQAKRAGVGLRKFNRLIVVMPQCNTNSLGQMPGKITWIKEQAGVAVLAHELGHNLGLRHAYGLICGTDTLRLSDHGRCQAGEYDDAWDAMGISPGQYSVPILQRLGWAGQVRTLTGAGTVTLAPAEHSGTGVQGLRVKVSPSLSYWIEYRTVAPRVWPHAPLPIPGVQIRRDTGGPSMVLLDGHPNNPPEFYFGFPDMDLANPGLPVGQTLALPGGIAITLSSQTPSAATVKVAFHVSANAPAKPASVRAATQGATGYQVAWKPPASNGGSMILGYLVSAGGTQQFLPDVGGTQHTSLLVDTGNLVKAGDAVSVTAINDLGRAAAATRAVNGGPVLAVTSPHSGDTVEAAHYVVTGNWAVNSLTNQPLESVCASFSNDGYESCSTSSGPGGFIIEGTTDQPVGARLMHVVATDVQGGSTRVDVPVVVVRSHPTLTVTSPSDGATLSGSSVDVGWSATHADALSYFEIWVDGSLWDTIFPDPGQASGTYPLDLTWLSPGSHTIQLQGTDYYNAAVSSATVTFTYSGP